MKLLIFTTVILSLSAFAGKEGVGGFTYTCFSKQQVVDEDTGLVHFHTDEITSIDLLDFWEREYGSSIYKLKRKDSKKRYTELLEDFATDLGEVDPVGADILREQIGEYDYHEGNHLIGYRERGLIPSAEDASTLLQEKKIEGNYCYKIPIAFQNLQASDGDKKIVVDKNLFFHPEFSENERLGLITHEFFYEQYVENGPYSCSNVEARPKCSQNVRKYNFLVHSNWIDLSPDNYFTYRSRNQFDFSNNERKYRWNNIEISQLKHAFRSSKVEVTTFVDGIITLFGNEISVPKGSLLTLDYDGEKYFVTSLFLKNINSRNFKFENKNFTINAVNPKSIFLGNVSEENVDVINVETHENGEATLKVLNFKYDMHNIVPLDIKVKSGTISYDINYRSHSCEGKCQIDYGADYNYTVRSNVRVIHNYNRTEGRNFNLVFRDHNEEMNLKLEGSSEFTVDKSANNQIMIWSKSAEKLEYNYKSHKFDCQNCNLNFVLGSFYPESSSGVGFSSPAHNLKLTSENDKGLYTLFFDKMEIKSLEINVNSNWNEDSKLFLIENNGKARRFKIIKNSNTVYQVGLKEGKLSSLKVDQTYFTHTEGGVLIDTDTGFVPLGFAQFRDDMSMKFINTRIPHRVGVSKFYLEWKNGRKEEVTYGRRKMSFYFDENEKVIKKTK